MFLCCEKNKSQHHLKHYSRALGPSYLQGKTVAISPNRPKPLVPFVKCMCFHPLPVLFFFSDKYELVVLPECMSLIEREKNPVKQNYIWKK